MAASEGEINLLGRPEAPGADHEIAAKPDQDQPRNGDPPLFDGIAVEEMDCGGEQAGGCGNGHADKVLAIGPAGVARLCVVADVEERQPRSSAEKKEKTDEGSGLQQMHVQLRIHGVGQKVKSPDEGQQAGRHAEGNDVSQ